MTVAAIRRAVADSDEHPRLAAPLSGQAAVALIFAGADGDLSLCFIQRATHPRDPWSGQMALPGGRASAADGSLRTPRCGKRGKRWDCAWSAAGTSARAR